MFHYQDADDLRGAIFYQNSRAASQIFVNRPLLSPPGQTYRYSSWGYTLLGALVEEASGMRFPDYVSREIASGLPITADATGGSDPNVSVAYELAEGTPKRAVSHDFSYSWAGGGMAATPWAVAAFGGRMIENRIVKPETFDWMLKPARLSDGTDVTAEGYRVGFGWRTMLDRDGARIAFHNGVALGARSALVLWRDEGTAVSLLSNASWTSSIDGTAQMLAAPHRPQPRGLVAAPCPIKSTRYVGTFGGQPVTGAVRFRVEDGLCVGSLEAKGDLKTWLSRGPQRAAGDLRLIGLDGSRGLARAGLVRPCGAGLVTPFGIYDVRAAADGTFKVPFGGTRELVVRLAS
jgi:hypothetical protein